MLGANFPNAVVFQKFRLMQESLGGLEWDCTPEEFLTEYKKLRRSVQQLLNNGANARELNVDAIAVDLDWGKASNVYWLITRAVSPTSVEAERTLSCLSRLRTKFRRNICIFPSVSGCRSRKQWVPGILTMPSLMKCSACGIP